MKGNITIKRLFISLLVVLMCFNSTLPLSAEGNEEEIQTTEEGTHVHDETCYEDEYVLICEEEHEHTEECYEVVHKLVCEKEETQVTEEVQEELPLEEEVVEEENNQTHETILEVKEDEELPEETEVSLEEETTTYEELYADDSFIMFVDDLSFEDYTGETIQEEVVVVRPKMRLLAAGNPLIPDYEIPDRYIITKGARASYFELLGKRYTLPANDSTHDIPSVPDETPVRLSLSAFIPTNLRANQAYIYNLPGPISWQTIPQQPIRYNGEDVGTYEVVKNPDGKSQVRLVITKEDFISQHSDLKVRMMVDGRVDASLINNDGDKEFEFPGIGKFKIDDVPEPAKKIVLRKKVAANMSSSELPNFIVEKIDDSVTPAKKTLIVYYNVVVNSDGGTINNIQINDVLSNPTEADFVLPIVGYVQDSFMFGKSYGTRDREIEGQERIKTTGTDSVWYKLDIADNRKSFDLEIESWNPYYGNLYITYGVEFEIPTGLTPFKGDPEKVQAGIIRNNMKGHYGNEPDVYTSDDFIYENKPIDKKGSPAKDSYTVNWTVTLNDYGDLSGFVVDGMAVIKDTLQDPVGADKQPIKKPGTDETLKQEVVLETDDKGNPKGFSIYAYKLNSNGRLASVSNPYEDMRVYDANATDPVNTLADPTTWTGRINNATEFLQHFVQSNKGPELSGIYAPTNVKYVIRYQSKIAEADQGDLPVDGEQMVSYDNGSGAQNYPVKATSKGNQYIAVEVEETNPETGVPEPVTKYYKVSGGAVVNPLEEVPATEVSEKDSPVTFSKTFLKNKAENGPNTTEESPTSEDGIGVGPSQPETTKEYGDVKNSPNMAEWTIALDITDDKVQVKNNTIYDFLEYGHELCTTGDSCKLEFYVTTRDKSGKLVMTDETTGQPITPRERYVDWENDQTGVVTFKSKTTAKDTEKPSKENAGTDGSYNFSFNVGKALGLADGTPLPKGSYVVKFKTILDESVNTGPVDGKGFRYINKTYAIKNNNDLIQGQDEHIIVVIDKNALNDSASNALYEKVYGTPKSDLAYQEMPWMFSSKVIINGMTLKDEFYPNENNRGYGEMELNPDSVVVYQTTTDITVKDTRNNASWIDSATKVDPSNYTITNNGTKGFNITFKENALSMDANNRVAVFYKTKALDSSIKNNATVNYHNVVSIDLGPDKKSPSDWAETPKKYEIIKKNVDFDPDKDTNPKKEANYSIDINKSMLDLNHDGDTINLEDNLDGYLDYVAGSMTLMDYSDPNNPVDITSECTIDASNTHQLKLVVPDEKYIVMTYTAIVTYNPEEGGEKEITNEILLFGSNNYSDSSLIQVSVIEHSAEIVGSSFDIRVYKYDEQDPAIPLPGAEYDVYAYDVVEDSEGKKYLELLPADTLSYGENPYRIVTDENGEVVFHGKFNVVYKIVEVKAPEGYVITDIKEYFVRTTTDTINGPDYYKNIEDENKKLIDAHVYHIYEDVDEIRYTMANRRVQTELMLTKYNPNGLKLNNVIFELYKADPEATSTIPYTSVKGKMIDKFEVDKKDCNYLIKDLEEGEYYLVETSAHFGFKKPKAAFHFSYDGQLTYTADPNNLKGHLEIVLSEDFDKPSDLKFYNYFEERREVPDTSAN